MLQKGSNEEIENCSVCSKNISIDDMESLEGNEMAKLSHKVDIKSRKRTMKKSEMIMKVNMRNKIVRKIERMIQKKRMYLTTI